MKNKFILLFLVISAGVLFFSCSKKEDQSNIELDNSVPLALAPDVKWAVITSPYASYKTTPDWDAPSTGHCRKGDILMITGKTTVDNTKWYKFEQGWLTSDTFSIYSNRYKAISASELLMEK